MGSENFLVPVVVPGWSFPLAVGTLVSPPPFNGARFVVHKIRFAEIPGVQKYLVGCLNIIDGIEVRPVEIGIEAPHRFR